MALAFLTTTASGPKAKYFYLRFVTLGGCCGQLWETHESIEDCLMKELQSQVKVTAEQRICNV